MSDVMISSSGTYHSDETTANGNGNACVFVTRTGTTKILSAEKNVYVPSGTLIARYTDRFDDPRYYTGDSAS